MSWLNLSSCNKTEVDDYPGVHLVHVRVSNAMNKCKCIVGATSWKIFYDQELLW